jgi:hypothetical protein
MNPRSWLQDYPPEIRNRVPPKTAQEKKLSLIWGIPFLITLLVLPLLACLEAAQQSSGNITYSRLFLNAFGVAIFFNMVDLVVIDWLIVCGITPKFLVLPGTEGMKAYKDYFFHFKAFLIGTILSVLIALLISAIVYVVK